MDVRRLTDRLNCPVSGIPEALSVLRSLAHVAAVTDCPVEKSRLQALHDAYLEKIVLYIRESHHVIS